MHAAVLEGSHAQPQLIDSFDLRTSSVEPSEQAVDLAKHLSGRVAGKTYERAAIRVAGASPVGRRNKAAFSRAHCEGALLFVLREALGVPVLTVDPVTAPKTVGMKKAELEDLVETLTSKGVNSDALLAGLVALTDL